MVLFQLNENEFTLDSIKSNGISEKELRTYVELNLKKFSEDIKKEDCPEILILHQDAFAA